MSRWAALVLALVAGAGVAFALLIFAVGILAGVLWIYVFGDNPWPAWAEHSLDVAVPLVGLAMWAIAASMIFRRLTDR